MEKEADDIGKRIEIKSDSVNEVLGKPPGWAVRWGITVLFSVLLLLLIGSTFFNYPDIITAPVVITSGNLPVQMIPRSSGRIRLFVKESDSVKKGEVISYIENPVAYESYSNLKKTLSDTNFTVYDIKEQTLTIGTLQDYYQNLLLAVKEFNEFKSADYHSKKIVLLKKQLKIQNQNIKSLNVQADVSKEQLSIAEKMYLRDSLLFSNNAISSLEFQKSKSSYLSIVQQHETRLSACNSAQITLSQTQQTIFDTSKEKSDLERKYSQTIKSSLEILKSKIAEWEQSYLLVSPINGSVSLTQYWQTNQNIEAGEVLMTIIPDKKSNVIGKVYLPLAGAGKVEYGQKVNIKLDNYPYMEFGVLQTTIAGISASPVTLNNQKQLVISLDFKNSLTTNYHIHIPVNEEMTGIAEIITKDLSAFERIINPIKYLLKTHNK